MTAGSALVSMLPEPTLLSVLPGRSSRTVTPEYRLHETHHRAVSPNKSLQRSGRHKVLGRGRPSAERTRALRARVLKWRRAAAELNR